MDCIARQAPLSMGFFRLEYWSGLPCPPTGDLPDSEIKPMSLTSPALAGTFFVVVQSLSQKIKICLCNPKDCNTPGFPVLHYLPEFAKTHVHWVDDAIQPTHPLLPTSPPCPQSFPESGSFPVRQLFTSGGQSVGALASVLPMNIQDWSALGSAGLISLQSKGLSKVFSSTTIQKHQFFRAQPSLWPNAHICIWLLEKP